MQHMVLIEDRKVDISTLKYKIPNYLSHSYSLLIMNNDIIGVTEFIHNLVISLGNGESLWKNMKIKKFNTTCNDVIVSLPLYTKKECNLFLNVPENIIIDYLQFDNCIVLYVAITYALVIANNGSTRLFWFLNSFRKFRKDMLYEKTSLNKYKIIKWLCKIENEIKSDHYWDLLNPTIDYLLYKFENDSNYSLKGRTYNSINKQMEIWHKELHIEKYSKYPQTWNHILYVNNFEIELENKQYTITEILSAEELYQEGKELSHCVLSYIETIFATEPELTLTHRLTHRNTTIWSLKENGKRLITIELSFKFLQQCRGYKNRLISEFEKNIIEMWMQDNKIFYPQ